MWKTYIHNYSKNTFLFFSGQLNIKKSPHYILAAHTSDEQNNKQDNICRKKVTLPFEQMWYLEKDKTFRHSSHPSGVKK